MEASHPVIITYQGHEYLATGKVGTRRSNGAHSAEYRRMSERLCDERVWRDETGCIYED